MVLYVTVVSQQPTIPPPVHVAWPLLAIAFALADSFAVHVELRDNAHSFTMNELPLMIGLFLCTPGAARSLARFVGMIVALVIVRRQRAAEGVLQPRAEHARDGHRVDGVPRDHERDRSLAAARGAWLAAIAAAVVINLLQSAAITTVIRLVGRRGHTGHGRAHGARSAS